jgi:glucose/arabinose dehydrogenase
MPFHGGILEIDGSANGKQIALGFRNPIDIECHRDGHDHCFVNELALDYSATEGGREKLVPIHEGDNWGFPCCATFDQPYQSVTIPCPGDPTHQCAPDCTTVVPDTNSFIIGNTPFGLAFEDTLFPAPWDHRVFVVLHGDAGTWNGARLVAISLDPATGLPLPSSTVGGGSNSGAMVDFATGWDKSGKAHGRPSDVEFSPDGRLFVANDQDGEIFWIAPLTP